jgi:predicted Zn-dependent protease
VLAHEIAHVVQRHGTRAASKEMAAEVPLALLAGILGKSTAAQATALGISFGVGSYFLKNSRQSESEADLLGADIMYDAGYDPHALAEFFAKLEDQAGGRGSELDQFFSDHPDPGNRVESVSHEVATLPSKVYSLNSAEFLSMKQTVATMKPMTADQIAAWQKKHARAE